jgi:hypothetical protein
MDYIKIASRFGKSAVRTAQGLANPSLHAAKTTPVSAKLAVLSFVLAIPVLAFALPSPQPANRTSSDVEGGTSSKLDVSTDIKSEVSENSDVSAKIDGTDTEVTVNGQQIEVPANGSVTETFSSDDGETSVNIESHQDASSNSSSSTTVKNESSSSSQVHLQIESHSTTTGDETRGGVDMRTRIRQR